MVHNNLVLIRWVLSSLLTPALLHRNLLSVVGGVSLVVQRGYSISAEHTFVILTLHIDRSF